MGIARKEIARKCPILQDTKTQGIICTIPGVGKCNKNALLVMQSCILLQQLYLECFSVFHNLDLRICYNYTLLHTTTSICAQLRLQKRSSARSILYVCICICIYYLNCIIESLTQLKIFRIVYSKNFCLAITLIYE